MSRVMKRQRKNDIAQHLRGIAVSSQEVVESDDVFPKTSTSAQPEAKKEKD